MKTMDYLNKKIGKKKVQIANQNLEKTWDMNQNHLSPRYTTNIKEILEVKCQ
jgi:DNA polymerase V